MKNRILLLLLLTLLFASCGEDFLELTPSESIEASDAMSTPAKVNAVLIGAYDQMQYSYYLPYFIMEGDVKGEDVFVKSSGNYGRHVETYAYTELPTMYYCEDVWAYAYKVITNVNLVINGLEAVDMDEASKVQLIAESRGLRGYSYLNMIQAYAMPYAVDPSALGVPLILEPVLPSDPGPSRSTVQEVYAQIISDLTYAAENLVASESYRLTTAAAKGLLARAYLNMEDWANASKWAKEARDGYSLMTADQLLEGFQDDSNSEWMWSLRSVADDNNGYLHVASFYDALRTLGYNSFRIDVDFRALFGADDTRLQQIDDGVYSGGHVSLKFEHVSGWVMDQVLMRASEMYLIEAEAEAELGAGHETAAQDALFAIQSRADATAVKSTSTGETLINEVLLERRKELWGEGFRWFDLNRRGLNVTRTSSSHWALLDLPITDNKRRWPIPQDEIDANPNMVQNPGYAK
ncbi:RagB/SusD family nutrient uptake outer membrane protein [Labilibaculum sp. A4]|uniref:RagB/SusD family nutrient uptake outer membrane protein n=1 Tax=Labilibaculum euxinus TaxID=2686357 RepID=UPI000F617CC4|nr:RagB/SusD family nutrient uptake outer membrane protein [Labilibaculum euxinus]MDQ1769446.1 RagB/SusD family nutrient uptake outer membrane protein [Labilibaculum euxinus]MWN74970.1 RagB/SusD family nutrient uptake outer membrane protein [Labilibaculum euxinus]